MYNLLELSYFLKNAPYLRVIMPIKFQDIKSFELMLEEGIKEVFVIIPNIGGVVLHLTNLQFRPHIKRIKDLLSVSCPGNAIMIKQENLYLETNGIQILDNSGMILFKKDVEKYIIKEQSNVLLERIFDTVLETALNIHFSSSCQRGKKNDGAKTSIDLFLNNSKPDHCKSCVDRLAGPTTNSPLRKSQITQRITKRKIDFG